MSNITYKPGNAQELQVIAKTPAGKEIGIRVKEGEAGWSIAYTSGGELPAKLQGRYTRNTYAVTAIHSYIAEMEAAVKEIKAKSTKVKGKK